MSFEKPSQVTNATGAYTFKSGVSSSSTNYIDNEFPNALDKTGDTITGNISVVAGGGIVWYTGSGMSIDSGAHLYVNSGGVIQVNSSGAVNLESGGTLTASSSTVTTFQPGAEVIFAGANVAVSDSTPPQLADPFTLRNVVQACNPLFFVPLNTTYSNSGFLIGPGWFRDGGETGWTSGNTPNYILSFSKVINGSTLTQATIFLQNPSGANNTAANATFSLWKCSYNSDTPSQIGATATAGTVAASGGSTTLTVGSLSEVIDDSTYSYYALVTASYGTGSTDFIWSAPRTQFQISNITQTF